MTESKNCQFNIEPLVIQIEKEIKNGLKVILKDYINRYDLLEQTHNQIMRLPSVVNELNKEQKTEPVTEPVTEPEPEPVTEPETYYGIKNNIDKTSFVSIQDITQQLVKKEILYVENKLDRIEKKYESITPLISKILDKLESINDEVKVLKENSKDNIKIEKSYISNTIQPSIISVCENENIKFEINEDTEDDVEFVEPVKIEKEVIVIKTEVEKEILVEEDNVFKINNREICDKENICVKGRSDVEQEEEAEEEEAEEEAEEEVEDEEAEEEEAEEEAAEEEAAEDDKDEVETEASEEEDEEEEIVSTDVPKKVEEHEEDEELEIVTIDDVDYCTNDVENGFIWELSEDGEQGNKIGYLKEGEPFFYADEK